MEDQNLSPPYVQKPVSCFWSFWEKTTLKFFSLVLFKLQKGSGIVFYVSYNHSTTMYVVPIELENKIPTILNTQNYQQLTYS